MCKVESTLYAAPTSCQRANTLSTTTGEPTGVLLPASITGACRAEGNWNVAPFVDTYRTLCLALSREVTRVLIGMEQAAFLRQHLPHELGNIEVHIASRRE
jgi:hypothetical protein